MGYRLYYRGSCVSCTISQNAKPFEVSQHKFITGVFTRANAIWKKSTGESFVCNSRVIQSCLSLKKARIGRFTTYLLHFHAVQQRCDTKRQNVISSMVFIKGKFIR